MTDFIASTYEEMIGGKRRSAQIRGTECGEFLLIDGLNPNGTEQIVSSEFEYRKRPSVSQRQTWLTGKLSDTAMYSGQLLTMKDGSQWFHPMGGGSPWITKQSGMQP